MSRVEVFVDGFNLYFGMRACNQTNTYRKTLWLDLDKFIKNYAIKQEDTLIAIHYFTSLPMNDNERAKRHEIYCSALKHTGINVIYGRYKTKTIFCPLCNQYFQSYEEKETDVNIALQLLRHAVEDKFDKAILFSGDSDLAPAIENTRILFPAKQIQVLFPINRNKSKRLQQVSEPSPLYQYLTCYKRCQFPSQIILEDGTTKEQPESWK